MTDRNKALRELRDAVAHSVSSDGESTERWALRDPGFVGSIKQLTHCGRCGEPLPARPHNEKRIYGSNPVTHVLCDDCYAALPD